MKANSLGTAANGLAAVGTSVTSTRTYPKSIKKNQHQRIPWSVDYVSMPTLARDAAVNAVLTALARGEPRHFHVGVVGYYIEGLPYSGVLSSCASGRLDRARQSRIQF
jgi:hypothetical protein